VLLQLPVSAAPASLAIDRAGEIRARLAAFVGEPAVEPDAKIQLTQYWPNWNNWHNWANWCNWCGWAVRTRRRWRWPNDQ
jgi:hypothetical protein